MYSLNVTFMLLQDIIQEISDAFQVDSPTPSDDGRYPFVFDNSLEVSISQNKTKDRYLIISRIDKKFEGREEETKKLLKNALQWHLARLKDNTETIAWDPELKQLILFQEISEDELDDRNILKYLEDFLNNLEFWNYALSGEEDQPVASPFPLSH